MLGIDAGGTFLKFGRYKENLEYLDHLNLLPLPYTREFLCFLFETSNNVYLSGAGAQAIHAWFPEKQNIEIIPELVATGLGGAYLAGLEECLVVNIGSGTPILYVNLQKKLVNHLGGTGMGSASLVGLAHYLTGMSDLDQIESEALKGDHNKVNLLISDIYNDPKEIGLPGDITASNFGKYQNWRHLKEDSKPSISDLLAGLHCMVAETIAVVSSQANRQLNNSKLPIVITGGGALNKSLLKYLEITYKYLKQEYIIPPRAVYATLHGIFVYKDLFRRRKSAQ